MLEDLKKKVLFATINHPASYEQLKDLEEGTVTHISLGQDHDELSKAVELDVCVKSKGDIVRSISLSNPDNVAVFGNFVLVNVVGNGIGFRLAHRLLNIAAGPDRQLARGHVDDEQGASAREHAVRPGLRFVKHIIL